MWLFLVLKLVTVGYATARSLRARYWPGLGAIGFYLYTTTAVALHWISPGASFPLGGVLTSRWWVYPVGITIVSTTVYFSASRAVEDERQDSTRHEVLDRVSFAFLGNAVLDGALLFLLTFAHVLAEKDEPF
jgi:hypothetical protein